jgi:hypothetical protein
MLFERAQRSFGISDFIYCILFPLHVIIYMYTHDPHVKYLACIPNSTPHCMIEVARGIEMYHLIADVTDDADSLQVVMTIHPTE